MARFVGILGDTGSGKSRSIINLDPKTTVVINVLGKDLPFKGASKNYIDSQNLFQINNYGLLTALLNKIDKSGIKVVVIDDMRFLMTKEFFDKATETGYSKFTVIAKNFQSLLELIQTLRKDLIVFGMFHDDDEVSDNVIVKKKIKLVGKLVEDQYNPVEVMGICLYCKPTIGKDVVTYQFYTNRTKIDGVEIPAKSPEGMFDSLTIPNDLQFVVDKINEYY